MTKDDKDKPRSLNADLLIISCEHSGDQHIANVLHEFLDKNPSKNVFAFAGKESENVGATLLFDITKYSVLGFIEVFKKYFFFKKLIKDIVNWVEKNQPKSICMVDSPSFNLRIAKILYDKKLLHKAGGNTQLYYYISPQIWAWKSERRFEIAKYVDSLATIFPFEKKCYADTNLDVVFTGHPFMTYNDFAVITYKKNAPILLLPGSRKASIEKIFPRILGAFKRILQYKPDATGTIIYPDDNILVLLRKILNKKYPCLLKNIEFVNHKDGLEASAAIMSSGTMSLRCCLCGIPGAIVYKTSQLTYCLGKCLIKVKWLGIANILLKCTAWREFLQGSFKAKDVGDYILRNIDNENFINDAQNNALEIKKLLNNNIDMSAGEWLARSIE